MRMLRAHLALLRAELGVAGRELGIIVGLAGAALFVAILVAILLYVGSFLFFGEWLFGSMGWGIIHGTLVGGVVIAFVAIDLAGGDVRRYWLGGLVGLAVAVLLAVLLLTNAGNESGGWLRDRLTEAFVTEDLPFGEEWLVTLSGLAVGAIVGGLVAAIVAWRAQQRGRPLAGAAVAGGVIGGLVGAIYASTRYEAPEGVAGLAIMLGLITWIATGLFLAYRRGFDPEGRYANLLPRETIAAFRRSRDFAVGQWRLHLKRMLGR